MMNPVAPSEVLLIALVILVVGATIALILVAAARRREAKRHKRVSKGRRTRDTSYDLLPDAPTADDIRTEREG